MINAKLCLMGHLEYTSQKIPGTVAALARMLANIDKLKLSQKCTVVACGPSMAKGKLRVKGSLTEKKNWDWFCKEYKATTQNEKQALKGVVSKGNWFYLNIVLKHFKVGIEY